MNYLVTTERTSFSIIQLQRHALTHPMNTKLKNIENGKSNLTT